MYHLAYKCLPMRERYNTFLHASTARPRRFGSTETNRRRPVPGVEALGSDRLTIRGGGRNATASRLIISPTTLISDSCILRRAVTSALHLHHMSPVGLRAEYARPIKRPVMLAKTAACGYLRAESCARVERPVCERPDITTGHGLRCAFLSADLYRRPAGLIE